MTDLEKALAEYHALDLRELGYAMRDIIVKADLALPGLSPLLDTSGPDNIDAPVVPPHPVVVSDVRPVWRALRDLSIVLDNQVQAQAQITGIHTFGSRPWYNNEDRHNSFTGSGLLNPGPFPNYHSGTGTPSTRTYRQRRNAKNRASYRRRKRAREMAARARSMAGDIGNSA